MPGGKIYDFICDRCEATFRDSFNLQQHYDKKKQCVAVGTVVAPTEWYCESCKRPFSTKGHYDTHLKSQLHQRMTNADSESPGENASAEVDDGPSDIGETIVQAQVGVSLEMSDNTHPPTDGAGPSSSFDTSVMTARPSTSCCRLIDTSKIRKTDENPPRVAVFDLVAVITGQRDAAKKNL